MWLVGYYLRMFFIRQYVACIRPVQMDNISMNLFIPTIKNIIYVGLVMIWLYLMCGWARLTSCVALELHYYASVELYYTFCRVTTGIWSFVNVWTFLRYLYTFWAQPYFYGNNMSVLQKSPIWKIYHVNLYHINILKLGTYKLLYSVVQKISIKFEIIIDI